MGILELFIIAVGVSMDSFAVSICGSLDINKNLRFQSALRFGLWFGICQGMMPIFGYYGAFGFRKYVEEYEYWIVFLVLVNLGLDMIRDVIKGEKVPANESFNNLKMFSLGIATSIDALAIGAGFALIKVNVWTAALIIGLVTFLFSFIGGYFGVDLGNKVGTKATAIGGIVLIGMGLVVLLKHYQLV